MSIARMIPLALVLAGGMLLVDAARPAQEAQAVAWEWFISPDEVYCEGCCSPRMLCCSNPHPCRVEPI